MKKATRAALALAGIAIGSGMAMSVTGVQMALAAAPNHSPAGGLLLLMAGAAVAILLPAVILIWLAVAAMRSSGTHVPGWVLPVAASAGAVALHEYNERNAQRLTDSVMGKPLG